MPPSSSSVQTGLFQMLPLVWEVARSHVASRITARPLFGVERTRNNSVKEYRCDDTLLTMLVREPVMMWCKKKCYRHHFRSAIALDPSK
uniref:Secreted protein n=1 Tax=Anopheles coluzzii TaxID=1518534 RepID=A0A6E8W9J9_ANOCL